VPLATYTGWNLRRRDVGAEQMLASLTGSYLPFFRSKAERLQSGDPRPSVQERYGNFDNYWDAYVKYTRRLVKDRYLLEEDARRLIEGVQSRRQLFEFRE